MKPGTFDLIQELFYRLDVSCLADLRPLGEDDRDACDTWEVTEVLEDIDATPAERDMIHESPMPGCPDPLPLSPAALALCVRMREAADMMLARANALEPDLMLARAEVARANALKYAPVFAEVDRWRRAAVELRTLANRLQTVTDAPRAPGELLGATPPPAPPAS